MDESAGSKAAELSAVSRESRLTTVFTAVVARAAQWTVPTLLMYAGADKLVDPRGSRAFAAAAPAQVVTAHCFEGLFHEIFNELDARPVFELLRQWLDERF